MEEIKKEVAVMMSFGGKDVTQKRKQILEFLRVKYCIEKKIQVKPFWGGKGTFYKYDVKVFKTTVGEIPPGALKLIAEADYLIALLDSPNPNVIYELTVRNLLRDNPILLCSGDPANYLPLYLKNMGYIPFDELTHSDLKEYIDSTAQIKSPPLEFDSPMPEVLRENIDQHDKNLIIELQKTFQKIEAHPPPSRQEFVLNLVRDLDPGRLLHPWKTYYRFAVLRQKWKRKSGDLEYSLEDAEEPLVVYDSSNRFFELFNLGMDRDALDANHERDPNGENPLRVDHLFERLIDPSATPEGPLMNKSDFDSFMEDQNRLINAIIYKNGQARALIPMRFNNNHLESYRNKHFLPALVGKRAVGTTDKSHSIYYLVVYVRVDDFLRSLEQTAEVSKGTDT